MTHHGQLYQRDFITPRSLYHAEGKFGRLFPALPSFAPDGTAAREALRQQLLQFGAPGGPMDAQDSTPPQPNPRNPDNPAIPAGFTFLGQFIDHDITFDPTSSLERQADPESIANFRTPAFELDSVYGAGRGASPHLYDPQSRNTELLIDAGAPDDLPRSSRETALLGDPRNDENLIISRLHLAFLYFHNRVLAALRPAEPNPNLAFDEAQRLVRWHYQWIILKEFLPLICGQAVVDDILLNGRRFYHWRHQPFIPVEFSVAAYRFGHTQVRSGYSINAAFGAPLFAADGNDLRGGRRTAHKIDWSRFFDTGAGGPLAPSKMIDLRLSTALFALPFTGPNLPTNPASLAARNLLRHLTFDLPSGQRVAAAMRHVTQAPVLTAQDLTEFQPFGLHKRTPLWPYLLREAELAANGRQLGPTGARIVAEVFIGLLQGDRFSFLRQDPEWQPEPPFAPSRGQFGMADLLRFAGVA